MRHDRAMQILDREIGMLEHELRDDAARLEAADRARIRAGISELENSKLVLFQNQQMTSGGA